MTIIDFKFESKNRFIVENLPGVRNLVLLPAVCLHKINPVEWTTKTNTTAENIALFVGLSYNGLQSEQSIQKLAVTSLPTCTLCLKKGNIKLIAVTLSNLNGFSKFFHWQIPHEICSKVIIKDPTAP